MTEPRSRPGAGHDDVKLKPLTKILDRKVYPPGHVIFAEGAEAERAYMILRGEVDISARNKSGKVVHLTTMHSGQVFGEMALLVHRTRSATATTKTACELLIISKSQMEDKMDALEPLMRLWVETLADRIIAATQSAQ